MPSVMSLTSEQNRPIASAQDDREGRWFRHALALVIGLTLFRLVYAALVPIDLVHDEAYYWDWSRQLDWGYYSKPPMVAWLIATSTYLFGDTAFAVRLPAILLGTTGLLLVYLLATRMYGAKVGFFCAAVTALTPGNAAMSLLMTIDAPLLFCWAVATYCLWRFLEGTPLRHAWLLATTVAIGIGLLSKQTMIAFVVLTGLFLLVSSADRKLLKQPLVWLCPVVASLFLLPVLWWNVQHDWITLAHTRGHFAEHSIGFWKRLGQGAEFIGSQFGVLTPVTCWLFVVAAYTSLRHFRSIDRRERFLLCFSGVPLIGVVALGFTQRVEPNWGAPFYLTGIILAVAATLQGNPLQRFTHFNRRSLAIAMSVGLLFVVGAYVLPLGLGLQGTKFDPVVRLRGWQQLGEQMETHASRLPCDQPRFVWSAAGRATASEVAFYMPSNPAVYVWNSSGNIGSQYDVWGGPSQCDGHHALIITKPDAQPPKAMVAQFREIESEGLVVVPIGSGRTLSYRVWRGHGFRSPEQVAETTCDSRQR